MNIKINRGSLYKEIQKIQNITPIKGTKPILSYFLLETLEDGIHLYATDLSVGMKVFVKAEVSTHGKVCLPARMVNDILRELPDNATIDIVLEENKRMRFSWMHSIFHVPSTDTTEFPPFPQFNAPQMYEIPLKKIVNIFSKVNVSVPYVEQKIYSAPAGALFTMDNAGIELVGTDGLRMAYIYMAGFDLPVSISEVIPKKLLEELPKMLSDVDKGVEEESEGEGASEEDTKEPVSVRSTGRAETKIGFSDNSILFSWPNTEIFAVLMEKKFPEYKEFVSVKNDKVIILDRERLRQAVRRVSLVSEKKEWYIRLRLEPGKFHLDSENAEVGDAHDEIDVEYTGEPLEIGFNPRYILDFLGVIENNEVVLEMSDNESLAILRPKDDNNIRFILMPVKL